MLDDPSGGGTLLHGCQTNREVVGAISVTVILSPLIVKLGLEESHLVVGKA